MASAAEQKAVRKSAEEAPEEGGNPEEGGRKGARQGAGADRGGRPGAPGQVVWPGAPTPLGARHRVGPDGIAGTNFALWAGGAEAVELCLFGDGGARDAAFTDRADP